MTDLPAGWYPIPADQALRDELQRECAPGHPLFGRDLEAIARREDRDDVLYRLADNGSIAQVHLTWTGAVEPPPWPTTTIFDSLDAWVLHAAVNTD